MPARTLQELGRIAREQIRADPFGFLRLSVHKLIWLYNHESIGVVWNEPGIEQAFGVGAVRPLKGLTHASWALIVLAAAWGAVALFRSRGVRRAYAKTGCVPSIRQARAPCQTGATPAFDGNPVWA